MKVSARTPNTWNGNSGTEVEEELDVGELLVIGEVVVIEEVVVVGEELDVVELEVLVELVVDVADPALRTVTLPVM